MDLREQSCDRCDVTGATFCHSGCYSAGTGGALHNSVTCLQKNTRYTSDVVDVPPTERHTT